MIGKRDLIYTPLICLVLAMCAPAIGLGLDNGLARTPPMGWNSWNRFACEHINEKVVREIADQMASNGMREAGYQYVVIDDCGHCACNSHFEAGLAHIIAQSPLSPADC